MKKVIAILSVVVFLFSFAACGEKPDNAEQSTVMSTEMPTEGRIDEKEGFYVFIPEKWCKMEYKSNGYKIRLFDIPSAPDIQDDTPEIMIDLSESLGTDVNASAKSYFDLHRTAEYADDVEIGTYKFRTITYRNEMEHRYCVTYIGLVRDRVCEVTLKGIAADDPVAQKVIRSISFKG